MRQWLGALALIIAASTTPVAADTMETHPEVLRACVAAPDATREALAQCIGAEARPCIIAEGPGTMSEALCWNAEAETWDALINEATTALTERAPYRDPSRLKRANTTWAAWADAECEYWAWEEGGGSGEQVERVMCAARLRAQRTIELMLAPR
ncbi:lysozyme inhibitor LprI family protein [Vitreimonas flagellata]|uniref:lysozyme inhibitor LprI family protein n=1 Tax=Vitreimonas flagellata TaxID=2560861 RepID=UPI00142F94E2|nr:lysozyme inhibitor LprI family protein [Vitreimonas flagellata]